MTDSSQSSTQGAQPAETRFRSGWGPRLFLATLAGLLAFFWWLLIYSGGVVMHHG